MIIWRERATRQMLEILKWLRTEGYQSAANNLVIRAHEIALKVSKNPEIGKPSIKRKTIRSYRIDDHRRLYYSSKGKKLFVVAIIDGRQNPSKNPY